MAKTWSLPDSVCKAIIHHHASQFTGLGTVPIKLISLLKVADYIAYTFGYSIGMADRVIEGEWDPEDWSERNETVMQELHLGPDELIDMKDNVFELLSAH